MESYTLKPVGPLCEANAVWPLRCEDWQCAYTALVISPQGRRIIALLLAGQRNKQIAAALGISPNTLHTELRRLYRRLGVHDHLGLVLRVLEAARAEMDEGYRPRR
jgi:DNA-binding CsgD family transcriptional regulator